MSARVIRALLRDTISPDVVHAGVKYNVIPGDAVVEVDCRVLPGTTEEEMAAAVIERIGPDLAPFCDVELVIFGEPVDAPAAGPLWDVMTATIRDHDPDGIPLPVMVPFATDAKHTARLGIPTYGFSPLRLDPDERFSRGDSTKFKPGASASMRCAGACPSSTTWSAASAAERLNVRPPGRLRRRR